jgi:8-oxo-dGTP diphosphatase
MAPATYAEILAGNVRAARSRKGIGQAAVVARMRELGYTSWHRQTMGKVERAERRLTAEEIYALAEVLETSVLALMRPTDDDKFVEFPAGQAVTVEHVQRLLAPGRNDGEVKWSGDKPLFPGAPMTAADARAYVGTLDSEGQAHYEAVRAAVTSGERPVIAAVITSPQGVLITRRHDGRPPWGFITGEQEIDDEGPEDTAIREAKEEAELQIRAGHIIGERDHPRTGRHMIYMAAWPERGTAVHVGDPAELAEVKWVSLAEADELLPGMFEPVREHLARELAGD